MRTTAVDIDAPLNDAARSNAPFLDALRTIVGRRHAGAGSAGIGIADMIVEAMVDEGRSREDACKRVTLFDVDGLIEASRKDLNPSQAVYARTSSPPGTWRRPSER
jgi:malic enzyme